MMHNDATSPSLLSPLQGLRYLINSIGRCHNASVNALSGRCGDSANHTNFMNVDIYDLKGRKKDMHMIHSALQLSNIS